MMNTCINISNIDHTQFSEDKPVRILSIDGGGVRGIMPAKLIAEIEKRTQKVASELFDVIAGVSIGSFIGAGLTNNYTGDKIVKLWDSTARETLSRSCARTITTVDGVLAPKWPVENMEKVLQDNFGDTLLTDCSTELICPALETTTGEPWYFSRDAAKNDLDFESLKVVDVVRASSAAQGYFRSKKLIFQNQERNFVDGSIFAPNPTHIAYSCAGDPQHSLVLSLGTGRYYKPLTYHQTAQMGFLGWVTTGDLINTVSQSNAQNVHELMQKVLPQDKYFRLQPNIDKSVSLDSVDDIPYLAKVTDQYIGDNDHEIDILCDALAAASKP